ncbi:hypothetical protein NTE_00194 [Candidatus Nitrososphaera evergladensis SR1]|uniref:MEDS domain-containing protein n=1 Tax=Candidatus Nitrososphaera evergladensis SR1 TaxID=1459636 RepID=A0A075MLF7_9ARCH|nr:hypothetical protein [Candidatus Nitrososphaera evergladensis]AIF82276.1 hypothetical protein NTE_00194 [Candidatus Nitrososphaera evergladensis SR1]
MSQELDSLDKTGHVLLLYDSELEREYTISEFIHNTLGRGHTAVLASISNDTFAQSSKYQTITASHDGKSERGCFILLDIRDCYEDALNGDFHGASKMREKLERILTEQSSDNDFVIIVVDCAEHLSLNEKFEECGILEKSLQNSFKSWERRGLKVLLICPHLASVLDAGEKKMLEKNHTAIAMT